MSEVRYGGVVQDALLEVSDWPRLDPSRLAVIQHFPAAELPADVLADYYGSVAMTAHYVCVQAGGLVQGESGWRLSPPIGIYGIAAVLKLETIRRLNAAERLFARLISARQDEYGRCRNGPFALLCAEVDPTIRYTEDYAARIRPDLINDVDLGLFGDPAKVNLLKRRSILSIVERAAPRQLTAEYNAFGKALHLAEQ